MWQVEAACAVAGGGAWGGGRWWGWGGERRGAGQVGGEGRWAVGWNPGRCGRGNVIPQSHQLMFTAAAGNIPL